MNIARYSIERPVVTWLLVVVLLVGGFVGYQNLSRLEDPEFTIKDAKVFTSYPGATAQEVEEEVTDVLETAVQQMPQLDEVVSVSKPGISELTVSIKDKYDAKTLPQVWDELRRKIGDAQSSLPPGTYPSVVMDDFGDVFGIYYALSGEGFSYKELGDIAKKIRKELLLVDGVAKIKLAGIQKENIFIEISREKAAAQGISTQEIFQKVKTFNALSPVGRVRVGGDNIRVQATSETIGLTELENILIGSSRGDELVRLKDVAKIKRDYEEVPTNVIDYNGKPAVTIGVSGVSGGNIVTLGEKIEKKLEDISSILPLGIELNPIYMQSKLVDESVSGFVNNLAASVAIVVVVLMLFMGARPGFLIGSVLLLTVSGTLLFMWLSDIAMQRISLGALIIAMGMLVDNAIVVTESIMVRIKKGEDGIEASSSVVDQVLWPLFGATLVGILAFAGIGLSQDSAGEYTKTLFYVIAISLTLSWFLAVTVTPLLCNKFFHKEETDDEKDPYDAPFFRWFRGKLSKAISHPYLVMTIMAGLLVSSIYGFGFVKQSFFPSSTNPIFYLDYWRPQGADIRATIDDARKMEKIVMAEKEVKRVTSFIGQGSTRMMLVYGAQSPDPSYAQLMIEVDDYNIIDELSKKLLAKISSKFPSAEIRAKKIWLGPSGDFKIEARFLGSDPRVLHELADKAKDVMYADGGLKDIRDDWRHREKTVKVVYDEASGARLGIARKDVNNALLAAYSGMQVGVFREGEDLIPITARLPETERLNIASLRNIDVLSPILGKMVPIEQVVSRIETKSEEARIWRHNRKRTITAQANAAKGLASQAFARIRSKIEAIELPNGYDMEWGGEYESSSDAQKSLARGLPMSFLAMILTVILLFGKIRQPLIIWLTVPLAIIGVTVGLLSFGASFSFMSLLGLLSLSGMLIKNAIVLIDQIDFERKQGKSSRQAILDSGVSRLRPVCMAAFTTVLGMIPLLPDAFFVSMAITIMAGLAFATVLTLIVVPVLYAIMFKVPVSD